MRVSRPPFTAQAQRRPENLHGGNEAVQYKLAPNCKELGFGLEQEAP